MKSFTISNVLSFLRKDGQVVGFVGMEDTEIHEIANITALTDGCISWIKQKSFFTDDVRKSLREHKDVLLVAPFVIEEANTIITTEPKRTFFSILNAFVKVVKPIGIHPTATVESKQIGQRVAIGANCYIGPNVVIGDDVVIHHNVVIENKCTIGSHSEIFSGVTIGSEGYGYYKEGGVPIHEQHYRGVKIGSHVDIGANTCIDRGLLGDTVIGNYVKIDNLCQIAHNVVIEDNCLIIAGTILCGSSRVERNSYMAPGSILMNQKIVRHDSMIGLGSVVVRNVKPNKVMFGCPAKVLHDVE